jgi:hypothetical protein
MDKETSSRVSSIASTILSLNPVDNTTDVDGDDYNVLLDQAKILAGSCLSQDETPGQFPTSDGKPGFIDRLKMEHAHLSGALDTLTIFIGHDMPGVSPYQRDLLTVQHSAMTVYLRVLQMRLTNLENDND